MDCIFCKIASGEMPAKIVYQDERAVAFEDINPQAPVHILIIPRKHIATVLEIEEGDGELLGHLFGVANRIAREREIAERGFRLLMNCNREAGQTVFHIHLHLLGGRTMGWPPG